MSDDYGERVVETEDPGELLDQLGLSKSAPKEAKKARPLDFEPSKGVQPSRRSVEELIEIKERGVGMEALGDGGKVLHAPPPDAPPIDLDKLRQKAGVASTDIGEPEEPDAQDEPEATPPPNLVADELEPEEGEVAVEDERAKALGDVIRDDPAVDAFLEAGSVEQLKAGLTQPFTEEFVVRRIGAKPMKVLIAPLGTARMATMREYMKVWRDSRGDKIAEEARHLVLYVINGTVKPQLTIDDKEWLLNLPWQTINDWAEAIQRISGILQQVNWDDRAQAIADDVSTMVEAGLKESFVTPFEDGLPSGVNENNLAAYMEKVIDQLMLAIGPLMNITVSRGQALGQDRFCHGDRGAPTRDDLKNA